MQSNALHAGIEIPCIEIYVIRPNCSHHSRSSTDRRECSANAE